jgi:hypothetical protein
MLGSYREAVCWMSRHEGAVLVVSATHARLVDVHHHNDGLNQRAAGALLNNRRRARWFTTETDGALRLLRLNRDGELFHRQLVASRQCSCPARAAAGA